MTDSADREPDMPFAPIDERLIYQGYVIGLFSTTWESPDGERFERDVVRHRGAVAVVPVVDDGEAALLVRQYRLAPRAYLLELPAGLCDVEGEPLIETAARELEEEIGYRAGRIEHLVSLATAVGFCDEQIHVYVADDLTETATNYQGVEEQIMTTVKVRFDDIDAMIAAGELTDAKTVTGLLMVRERLRSQ